jgi:tetratricopeptide (TPR) repeat protein
MHRSVASGRGGCSVGITIIMSSNEEQASDEACANCGKAAVDNVKLKMCTACKLAAGEEVCASCGKAAVGNVKLMMCTACKLVRYCGVDCQKKHRPQHKKACRKRAAELRDDRLFRQPDESCYGECPICCLPLPIDRSKSNINSCCCKYICRGCAYANQTREIEQGMEHKCPYCREPMPKSDEEADQNIMNRVKVNDPNAMNYMGKTRYQEGNYGEAFEYYTKAAALGDIESHFELSRLYRKGCGVAKDAKKEMYHLEEAAIGGHPIARIYIGNHEGENGRFVRATKHLIIASKLGHDDALETLKRNFRKGFVSKEDYEAALRGHQAAVDATKSKQREEAEEFHITIQQANQ